MAVVLVFSPAYAKQELNFAPRPFKTVEDLLYDTYVDLRASIERLGENYSIEVGQEFREIWSYYHEFDITNRPKEFMPRILKVYAQVHIINGGSRMFTIVLEETKHRLNGIEEIHHVYLEDHDLDAVPDVIEENWLVIDTSKGRRDIKSMKSKGDRERYKPKIDKRWNFWFAYWIKVQVLELKETFKLKPFQCNPKREV